MSFTTPIDLVKWNLILTKIKVGMFIPILGKDIAILRLKKNDPKVSFNQRLYKLLNTSDKKEFEINLYTYFAIRLIDLFKIKQLDDVSINDVDLETLTLNNVVLEILKDNTTDSIYTLINDEYDALSDDQIVLNYLLDLTKINKITTYIKAGFDDYLERALIKNMIPYRSINFSEFNKIEVPADFHEAGVKIINLFGSVREPYQFDYAITDELELEFLYTLNENKNEWEANKAFFEEIRRKNLYLIGCSFPNWLMRFFIRIISQERFLNGSEKSITDTRSHKDLELSKFLGFHKSTVIDSDNPIEFLKRLINEWKNVEEEPESVKFKESVFLSYASDDREKVESIYKEFKKAGVEVFFDKSGLDIGDVYEQKIIDAFKDSSYFVPVISEKSLDPDRYVYKKEWTWANTNYQLNGTSATPSIKPLLIDRIPKNDSRIPDSFRSLHIIQFEEFNDDADIFVQHFMEKNEFTLE